METNKILVVTDSSASLPAAIASALDIRVIPLWLIWGEECYLDGVDIDPTSFYRRLKTASKLPTSTQPSVEEFKTFFTGMGEECAGVVSILASSKISGTVESALAAQPFSPVPIEVVDSGFSAMGQGLIVIAAARTAAEGAPLAEVKEAAERIRDTVHLLFVVDTLEYLHKGGRIGGAKRLLGTALDIKPILHFEGGTIQPLSQTRTKSKAIKELLNQAKHRLGDQQMAEAAIVHVDCPDQAAHLKEEILDQFDPDLVHVSPVSPVVGTHVGPGALGLAFYPRD